MRTALCLVAYLIGMTLVVQGQDGGTFVRDSIHGDRGISGTLDFEPETRTYFPRRDEQGRVLEQEIHQIDNNGQWRPQSRRLFAYEDDQVSQMHIQVWNVNRGEWQDLRKDDYSYENGLLVEFVRQQISQGQLTNDRRWTYSYNEEEQETGILLQQWNGGDWENLSRKVVEYNQAGEMTLQTL